MDYLYSHNIYNCNNFYGIVNTSVELQSVHENINSITGRPIYYISDLHVEFKDNKGFKDSTYAKYINHVVKRMNDGTQFGEDPLLIAGDISCFSSQVDYFFSQLRMRREGIIIFVLGNHEIWNMDDEENRDLNTIIEKYRDICLKYDIILLHNELAFFFDERTGNGEIRCFSKKVIISENELFSIDSNKLQEYSNRAKFIVFGGLGFSGKCKTKDRKGNIYNADVGLYRDIVPTIERDSIESLKCEKAYRRILDTIGMSNVTILTHCPFNDWSDLEYNHNFIYVNGHTHHDYFENSKERTIFANNQVGYSKDCYDLKCFYVDGTYDIFEYLGDGIYEITHEQYIEFNLGKNIQLQKKDNGKPIYLIKNFGFYMFVYYNSSNRLVLLNGGKPKRLTHDIEYYYNNLASYGLCLTSIMNKYTSGLAAISRYVKQIGGDGKIHGCIVDIDYYNHIYFNPVDGSLNPYYAIDKNEKYVYKDLETLLEERCSRLLPNFQKFRDEGSECFEFTLSRLKSNKILEPDKAIYKVSNAMKTIQYILFKKIIREWNDKIIHLDNTKNIIDEINKIHIDNDKII